jgi:thiol-disulfide isomerase/thioredoxin
MRRNILLISLSAAMFSLLFGARLAHGQATPDPGNPIPTSGTNAPIPAQGASAPTSGTPAQMPGTSTPNPAQASAQNANPSASDAELPGVLYKEAMHPLDIVRQSLENWSDAELGALHIGMQMAHEACDKMNPDNYSKDDLYDLAHLCAFGQDWNPANTAAQRYLGIKAPEHRAQAYAISVGAFVHLNAIDLALGTAQEMLRTQPYDAEVAYTMRYMKDYLETAGNSEAVALGEQEHAQIVDALSKGTPLRAVYGDAVVSTGLLYEMAMEAAFFERYAGNDAQAASFTADVERALPQNASLTAEDRQQVDSVKLQYHLLGTVLEPIPVIRSYKSAKAKAQLDANFGAATTLVVFPDWCVQCKKMMPIMTRFGAVNAETPIYAYGLIFKPNGEQTPPDRQKDQKDLAGTDVMEVSEETARSFGTTDYPLGIVVDHAGVIRFIGVLPGDAFNGDGYMAKVITRMVGVQVKTLPGAPPPE